MVTEEGKEEEQQITEEGTIRTMDVTYDILAVLERHGVPKDQRIEYYWVFLSGEYCGSLMYGPDWRESKILEDIDKHRNILEKNMDAITSQKAKIKQLTESQKDKILNKRPAYVG